METLCLELAEGAGPDEAEALRSIAQNYRIARDQKRETFEPRFRLVLLMVAAFYLLFWTPLFLLLSDAKLRVEIPKGSVVEQISGFTPTEDGRFQTRTYKFAQSKTYLSDPAPLVVYEDANLLPSENYELQELSPVNVWRYVTLKTGDGSNPNKNGRRYYVVLH